MKILEEIKNILSSNGFHVTIQKHGVLSGLTLEKFQENPPFAQPISIIQFPEEENLDGSVFIQFYFESTQDISANNLVYPEILEINRLLPLGHFNLTKENKKLSYKYVFTAPKNGAIDEGMITDIIDMVIYAQVAFLPKLETLV